MKILNFGSLNIDFVYTVDHFVAKGETLSSKALNVYPGGKGLNQSLALRRAGTNVHHAGQVGEDGTFLRQMLADAGVDVSGISVSSSTRTGNAIIQNDSSGDNCILLYGGANRAISRHTIDSVLSGYSQGDWLVLQNEINDLPYIIEQAKERGMTIALNPSPVDEVLDEIDLNAISLFVLNEVEAAALVGDTDDSEPLLEGMRRKFPHAQVALTLGEKGAQFASGNKTHSQSAFDVAVVDTTAAGDTFTGYLIAELAGGAGPSHALRIASAAAALAVTTPGAAPSIPHRNQVEAFEREGAELP